MVGWIGSVLLTVCGLPQAIKVWRTKKANDLSMTFLTMWWLGEVFTFLYIYQQIYAKVKYDS